MKNLIALFCTGLMFSSCVDDLDFDKTEDFELNVGLDLPIIQAELNLDKFISENTQFIVVAQNGEMSINYREENAFEFELPDLASVEDQTIFDESLIIGNIDIEFEKEIDGFDDLTFNTLRLGSGGIKFTINTLATADPVAVSVGIGNATKNGNPFDMSFTSTSSSEEHEFSLEDVMFDFTTPGSVENSLKFKFSINSSIAQLGQGYDIKIELSDVGVETLTGHFGQLEVDIPEGEFELGIEQFDNFIDGLRFSDPKINLYTSNQLGVSFGLDVDFEGEREGIIRNLDVDNLMISQAPNPGDQINETNTIDNNSSNLSDFFESFPSTISYSGKATLNPLNSSIENFIANDTKLSGDIEIDIPMDFKISNLVYDYLIEDVEILGENDEFNAVKLKFTCENKFPLDAEIILDFLDENKQALDSLSLPLLESGTVEASGVITTPKIYEFEVELDNPLIQALKNTRHLNFRGRLQTSEEGNFEVKLLSTYNILIGMAIEGEYKLKND
ncbi:MAG: hypothetical protein ACPGEC_01355 [Flavobacteriales bacterium]